MAEALPTADSQDPVEGTTRRDALRLLSTLIAGSPLIAASRLGAGAQQALPPQQAPGRIDLPVYPGEIMQLVNLHEFEAVARQNISEAAYDYLAAGAADELTLEANRAAFSRFWIRRGVMRDTTGVDTSVDLLGHRIEHPILLGPVGLRNMLHPDGHRLTAEAALHTRAILVGAQAGMMQEMSAAGGAPMWWAATLGHSDAEQAARWAGSSEQAGAAALCVSVDYPYAGARDRPSRHKWESDWARTRVHSTAEGSVVFQAGMLDPYNSNLTWDWLRWARAGSTLPIVVKGITRGEDARLAVEHGAQAVSVSNHAGRTLDGMGGTLDVLPEVVDAVNGRVPVLVDGGIRRGSDVFKALGLGATAIMIGRPYLWGLGAYGKEGAQRVIEMLWGEFRIALGLSGYPSARAVPRDAVQRAWEPYRGA